MEDRRWRIAWLALAATGLAAVVGLAAPSRRLGIDERPGTFVAVLVYLGLLILVGSVLRRGFARSPRRAWRQGCAVLGLLTLLSTALDLWQLCFFGMSYTSWWKNEVFLFPGFLVRRLALDHLLPLVGMDPFTRPVSLTLVASVEAILGLGICGAVWLGGEILIGRRRRERTPE